MRWNLFLLILLIGQGAIAVTGIPLAGPAPAQQVALR
ncbi:hypothetical protein SAMN05216196_101470 [Lutimaribacter pacificus]|uniref:Uncharacterized protein n=1 Tax=Lutimaribacter pacificus TaxID=391948 RepID=A0A1H0B7D6_9RHOB|nr:hypothetical protein SAMN05216196_101470 [Lutimaribacter pacificus]SHJ59514.1 hypothetical protein SAMN05444142_101747 [Lutimaribacter pacificus]